MGGMKSMLLIASATSALGVGQEDTTGARAGSRPFAWLQHTAAPARPLLVHVHVPKTGGSSLIEDVVKHLEVRLCVPKVAMHKCIGAQTLAPEGALGAAARGGCEFTSCEASVRTASRMLGGEGVGDGLIAMVRSPMSHLYSMFAHCQRPGSRRFRTSFRGWLREARVAGGAVPPICGYNPWNMATLMLGNDTGAHATLRGLAAARLALERAAVAGVTEEYGASLCLLVARSPGRARALSKRMCRCDDDGAALRARYALVRQRNTARGRAAQQQQRAIRGAQGAVAHLTRLDAALHRHAAALLLRGVEEHGLQCHLRNETRLRALASPSKDGL